MKKKINFLAKEWKVKVGKDLPGVDKKYKGFEWIFELVGFRKNGRRKQQSG